MKKVVLLLMVVFLLLTLSLAYAQTRDKGMWVNRTTGTGVGSVYGVFIGVSEYKKKELNLSYADDDAQAMHDFYVDLLKDRVPKDHFTLLTDKKATRTNIRNAIRDVSRRAFEQDLVILFFSMHGVLDSFGDLYFIGHDADVNDPGDRGVSQNDLIKLLKQSRARKVALIMDACHAGGAGSSSMLLAMKGAGAQEVNSMMERLGKVQDGIALLTSSTAAERSQEREDVKHGVFTYYLLEGLKGAADREGIGDGNGLITVREAYDYAYRKVSAHTRRTQNPALQGNFDNLMPLAATRTSAPQGYRPEETKPVAKLEGGGPQDLAPINIPENVVGSVNWALQDDWADTVAYEEGTVSAGEKQNKWLAFAKKWKGEANYAQKARDRASQWGKVSAAMLSADKAWAAAKKRVGRKRIPVRTVYNAIAEILNTAPSGWSHRSEAEAVLANLKEEMEEAKEQANENKTIAVGIELYKSGMADKAIAHLTPIANARGQSETIYKAKKLVIDIREFKSAFEDAQHYMIERNFAKSIPKLKNALKLDRGIISGSKYQIQVLKYLSSNYCHLGNHLQSQGKFKKACKAYKRALLADSHNNLAREGLKVLATQSPRIQCE